MPYIHPSPPTQFSLEGDVHIDADSQGSFLWFIDILKTAALNDRKLVKVLWFQPCALLDSIPVILSPQEISCILSLLPNLEGIFMRLGEFSFVNDCMVTEPHARYSLRHFSIEFSSRKPIESGLPTCVPNWVLAEGLVFDFATLLSFFHSIDDLEILDSGGVGSQVDWSHTVAKIPDVFPHIKQHLRVKSLHVSADYKEPVLTPLLALLDHVLVPQGLEDFCARQIWNIYDVPYFASLLSHGNIKTLNFNLSGALDSPGNHLDPSHDMMAQLALSCTGQPEKISLGITRTDIAYPSVMVSEICTALTIVSLLPAYDSLAEIELYFDVRGKETEEKLIRALVGTREHWKWIDAKLSSSFPKLEVLTLRLEDNHDKAVIHEEFQDYNSPLARQEIAFVHENTGNGFNEGLTLFRRKTAEFECDHGCQQVGVTHPMRLCKFHVGQLQIDPERDFLEVFGMFFAETMMQLRAQDKIQVINEHAPWNEDSDSESESESESED